METPEQLKLFQHAVALCESNQFAHAILALDHAATKAHTAGLWWLEGRCYVQAGLAYNGLGQYQKAITHYKKALSIAKEIGNKEMEGSACYNLGIAYHSIGEYQKALTHHEKALSIAEAIEDKSGEGRAHGSLGNAYDSLGEYQKAITHHKKALSIAEAIEDKAGKGRANGNLGNVYQSLGEYQKAITYHEGALSIFMEIRDKSGECNAYGNLGIAYHSLGEYQEAITHHEKCLDISMEIGKKAMEGGASGNLGNVYQSLGEYQKAITYHETHLSIAKEIGDKEGEARARDNLNAVVQVNTPSVCEAASSPYDVQTLWTTLGLGDDHSALPLTDLHAHLLGMGTAEEWINILETMSEVQPVTEIEVYARDQNTQKATTSDPNSRRVWCETTFQSLKDTGGFASDVPSDLFFNHVERQLVLSGTSLYNTFLQRNIAKLVPGSDPDREIQRLIFDQIPGTFRDLYVWDARAQQVIKRYGMFGSGLLEIAHNNSVVRGRLRNAFAMLDPQGNPADPATIRVTFRDHFTPQFYPARFSLKDDLYEQFPSVLTSLIDTITRRYACGGVGYAELSVGAGDLLARPHILRRLPNEKNGVVLRYLAMFGRHQVQENEFSGPSFDNYFTDNAMYPDKLTRAFRAHLQLLDTAKTAYSTSPDVQEKVVGFDYASNEDGHPYCPFHLPAFMDFLHSRLDHGPFGYRIHTAERLPSGEDSERRHVEIISLTLVNLLTEFGETRPHTDRPFPIRIGHGIGFGRYIGAYVTSPTISNTLTLLKSLRVPIETCLTSNDFLVLDSQSTGLPPHWIRLLQDDFNVLLATDDDGIWPCEFSPCGYLSLAAEYARAHTVAQKYPQNSHGEGWSADFPSMIARSHQARFTQ